LVRRSESTDFQDDAAKESSLPGRGLPGPASFAEFGTRFGTRLEDSREALRYAPKLSANANSRPPAPPEARVRHGATMYATPDTVAVRPGKTRNQDT
jgi:hypothetical protein